jgi:hypothetical protein
MEQKPHLLVGLIAASTSGQTTGGLLAGYLPER